MLGIIEKVWDGSTNVTVLAIGGSALVLILVLKRWPRLPGMLIAVAAATIAVAVLDLASARRRLCPRPVAAGAAGAAHSTGAARQPGAHPDGWPRGRARLLRRHQCPLPYLRRASANAGRSESGDGGPWPRERRGRIVSGLPDQQQLFAHTRSEAAGAKTQLTGVVGALAIALLLLFAPALIQDLPNTALAAIVIASAIGLIEVADLRRIYRIQRWEFWLSMACFAGVAVFGAIPGIVLAIVIAVIEFLWDGWRPHSAVLGRVDDVKGYHDITRYPNAHLIPGLVLFRWDAPLFFANAEFFHDRVLDAVASSPTPVRWLVVAAEPVTSIDVTAADAVSELHDTLHAAGIEMHFAEMKDPVKDKLKRFGLFTHFGEQSFFATIEEAVSGYLTAHPVIAGRHVSSLSQTTYFARPV